jgi:hypothetical protein
MSTVREARIAAARRAILNVDPWITTKAIREMAENVVGALFPPDSLIDNAKVENGMSTLEQLNPIREGLRQALTELVDGVDVDGSPEYALGYFTAITDVSDRIARVLKGQLANSVASDDQPQFEPIVPHVTNESAINPATGVPWGEA